VTTSEGVVVHTAADPKVAGITQVRVTAGQESTKSASRPAEPVHAAPPATLREAPARPASTPRPTKSPKPSTDRADPRSRARAVDPVLVAAPSTKDRAKSSKIPQRQRAKAGER